MNNTLRSVAVVFTLASVFAPGAYAQKAPAGTTHETAGEYVDNALITAKVKAAFLKDSELKVLRIKVRTVKDVVHLSGTVKSAMVKAHAAQVAGGVDGVASVKNDLTVK